MLSKNETFEKKIKSLLNQQENQLKRNYDWIEEYQHINFWDFLSINYLELDRFFTLLDIETGPTSGWEKFAEAIGLNLWEDRKWCHQYHNGAGPTKAALCKILSKNAQDIDFNLSHILLLIKEMERYDILLQIDWRKLVDKYELTKTKASEPQSKEREDNATHTILLRLYNKLESSLLVQSSNIGQNNGVEIIPVLNDEVKNRPIRNKKHISQKATKYPTILMTYASDAIDEALKICEQLKEEGIRRKKINVLLLHSTLVKSKLLSDSSNTLHSFYKQVRYVVPILSPRYVQQIQNINFLDDEDPKEAQHNRFIYRLMLDQFVDNGSRNLKCRPICPDRYKEVLSNSVINANGLFSIIWSSKPDDIEELGEILMDKPLEP